MFVLVPVSVLLRACVGAVDAGVLRAAACFFSWLLRTRGGSCADTTFSRSHRTGEEGWQVRDRPDSRRGYIWQVRNGEWRLVCGSLCWQATTGCACISHPSPKRQKSVFFSRLVADAATLRCYVALVRVKYAVNTETGKGVAIKILDKEKIQKQNMGAQIKKEVREGDSLLFFGLARGGPPLSLPRFVAWCLCPGEAVGFLGVLWCDA